MRCRFLVAGLAMLSIVGPALCPAGETPAADSEAPLLFTSFRGNGEDGLHLAWSKDGYTWTPLKNDKPLLRPEVGGGLMRDPQILQGPDGTFHMVWTTAWNKHGIGYANSKDLIHWSKQKLLDVMKNEPQARNVWAPELFYDAGRKQFIIFWASTIPGRFPATEKTGDDGYNHRMYFTRDDRLRAAGAGETALRSGFQRDRRHDRPGREAVRDVPEGRDPPSAGQEPPRGHGQCARRPVRPAVRRRSRASIGPKAPRRSSWATSGSCTSTATPSTATGW